MNMQEGEMLRGQPVGKGRLEKEDNTAKPIQCLLVSHRRFTERQAQEAD